LLASLVDLLIWMGLRSNDSLTDGPLERLPPSRPSASKWLGREDDSLVRAMRVLNGGLEFRSPFS